MPQPRGAKPFLDETKRKLVLTLIANGSSRCVAARYVGCSPSTITRTMARNAEFAERLIRAEQTAEITLLRRVHAAAQLDKNWQAAAWVLERHNPDDFTRRPPRTLAETDVIALFGRFVELLRGEISQEDYRKTIETLDSLMHDFQTAEAPLIVANATEPNAS